MTLFENISDCIYNFFLPKKHKKNIKKSRELLKKIAEISKEENGYARSIGYLRKIDPFLFEELIMSAFEKQGHRVKRNMKYTGDGGFDGNVRIGKIWHGIQCKRYENSINPAHVREFTELTEYGFFVHTGRTGDKSREYISTNPKIKIISGSALIDLIAKS